MNRLDQLRSRVTSLWTQFTDWVKLWPDVLAQMGGMIVFIASAPLFAWLADQFGDVESGILQNLIITGLEVSFISGLVFLGILLNFRIIFDWYKKKHAIEKDWFALTSWQRFLVFLILFCSLFFSIVYLAASLQ